MSAARLGQNWADVDEEDEDDIVVAGDSKFKGRCFETAADENGIKTVVEYKERDGKTYKVTKRVKQTTVTKWSNPEMGARKTMAKFGKVKLASPQEEAQHIVRSVEDVMIEVSKKAVQLSQSADAEDKFYEEALKNCESMFKEKKSWSALNADNQTAKDNDAAGPAAAAPAPSPEMASLQKPGGPAKYVPPSIARAVANGKGGKGDGKGGKGGDEEASLRITNLSEDVKEGDLQDLFSQFGRLQRVYLAKDMTTLLSKGFAFITYYTRGDAQKAIDKLNGHGYDNLIIGVQWAKPKA